MSIREKILAAFGETAKRAANPENRISAKYKIARVLKMKDLVVKVGGKPRWNEKYKVESFPGRSANRDIIIYVIKTKAGKLIAQVAYDRRDGHVSKRVRRAKETAGLFSSKQAEAGMVLFNAVKLLEQNGFEAGYTPKFDQTPFAKKTQWAIVGKIQGAHMSLEYIGNKKFRWHVTGEHTNPIKGTGPMNRSTIKKILKAVKKIKDLDKKA